MPFLIIIPFVAFGLTAVVSYLCLARVRHVLAEDHVELWLTMSRKVWFIDNAVWRFIWRGKDRGLNDRRLTGRCAQAKLAVVLVVLSWLSFAVIGFSGVMDTPPGPATPLSPPPGDSAAPAP